MVPLKRTPPGYVSKEAADAIRQDIPLPELIAEFESKFYRSSCKVCDSTDFRELIDTLLLRGASCDSVCYFLSEKFNFAVGKTTLLRHKRLHLNARSTE